MRTFAVAVLALVLFGGGAGLIARAIEVDINVNVKHEVGGIDTFNRSKFVTIHASHTEPDWNGGQQGAPNFTNDLLGAFMDGYDVYFGRDTGYISGNLRYNIAEDPSTSGWARLSGGVNSHSIIAEGSEKRSDYHDRTWLHPYESRAQTDIIAAQFQPFWPDGTLTSRGWALSQTDTPDEPFGSATGHFMGHFLNHFYGSATQVGRPLPTWVEVMNEPDWPLFDNGSTPPSTLWKFHNSVANEIRAATGHLDDAVKIGGYCAAFPDLERDHFQEWQDEWVTFIDTCGTNMDFYTLHFYDFEDYVDYYRKGSNLEATLDMIEHYSNIRLGTPLPFVISEFGGRARNLENGPWSAYRDWKTVKSWSSMVMSFMDRPDLIGKVIPFVIVKAEWGRDAYPYAWRLMRQADEPASYSGEWVYTEMVKFYQLWSDVNGTRVDVVSSDPDVQTDAYVDGNKAYVILNNLLQAPVTVDLVVFEDHGNPVQSVREKNMYWNGSIIALDASTHIGDLAQVQLGAEGTAILEYGFADSVHVNHRSNETKHYADTYFQPIFARNPILFHIDGVPKGPYGDAVLRLGMGRDHARSKQPDVRFNGVDIRVPSNFMGHEGDDRAQFFGLLDIPIPYALVQSNNTVSVTFRDNGGYVSSAALRAYAFSKDVRGHGDGRPVIASIHLASSDVVLQISHGVPDAAFDLMVTTDLVQTSAWTVAASNLTFDAGGAAVVSNAVGSSSQAFFGTRESPGGPPPAVTMATFDWAEVSIGSQWWNGYNYTETENGITMVAGGRAASIDGGASGRALKASYPQDADPGTFAVQTGGTNRLFTVQSIDVSANDGGGGSAGTPSVQGMRGGIQQWAIVPPTDSTFHTYGAATFGDLSLQIDEIVWHGPSSDGTIWNNEIDNLTVYVELP